MQRRHLDRKSYFKELAQTSQEYYLPYLLRFCQIRASMNILEVGCGEGGNLVPFALNFYKILLYIFYVVL